MTKARNNIGKMDKIARVRQEIERRSHGEQGFNSEDAEYGYRSCARDLLSFLDTLSEEPVQKFNTDKLQEIAKPATPHKKPTPEDRAKFMEELHEYAESKKPDKNKEEAAEAYQQQVIEETKNHIHLPQHTYAEGFEDALHLISDAFIAGWECRDEQMLKDVEFDSQVFGRVMSDILAVYKSPSNPEEEPLDYEWTIARHFYELGKKNMKEKMLKEAVEKTVGQLERQWGGNIHFMHGFEVDEMDFPFLNSQECGYGDKVRIVVLKEEEE